MAALARSVDWDLVRGLLLGRGVWVEPGTAADAELAGHLWPRGSELPLADRLCLALGTRLAATLWTADTAGEGRARVRPIR